MRASIGLILIALLLPSLPTLAAGDHTHATDMTKGPISDYRTLNEDEQTIQAVLDT